MQIRGKWVILTVMGISVAAALFAVWFNHRLTHRTTAAFRPDVIRLIAGKNKVELLELDGFGERVGGDDSSPETSQTVTVHGKRLRIVSVRDISEAAGLIHARYALRQDASFDWAASADDRISSAEFVPSWDCALRFSDAHGQALLIVDTLGGLLHVEPIGADVVMSEKLRGGLRIYIDEQLGNGNKNPNFQ